MASVRQLARQDDLHAQRGRIGHAHAGAVGGHDGAFVILAGIIQHMLEQEAVELGFGQRIGALLLDGIFRGHHHEAFAQCVRLAIQRDAALLHGFQQRRLGLGRGAVDFVRQQQFAEDRPLRHGEAAGLEVEQVDAQDVARHQVGRELYAAELQPQTARKGLRKQRLGYARRTFQQDMAAREQGSEQQVDRVGLADHGLGHLGPQCVAERFYLMNVHW